MNIVMRSLLCFLCYMVVSDNIALQPVKTKQGMVVSEHQLASQIGVNILRSGGNAIDAAVAVGYALAVVNPCCGNLGGGGFMTIHLANGKNVFLNFRERAPLKAKSTLFLNHQGDIIPQKSTVGYLAVGVPGTVLGFDVALKKYGTMTRQQLIAPAIHLAEKGYILTPSDAALLKQQISYFKTQSNIAAIFLKPNQTPYEAGDRLIQQNLANTLKKISQTGSDAFYKGSIAKTIVQASHEQGGILSMNDFTHYRVEAMAPLYCTYRGYQIITAPPPSSGGTTLCEMLNILENYPLSSYGFHSSQSVHYIVEAMRYAFYDRNNQLGDPDFVKNPIAHLTSKQYAKHIAEQIPNHQAILSSTFKASSVPNEGVHTTHYSIIDKDGNAVAVTYTLNSFFGAKVIAGNTGFFLNNEMDDFTAKMNVPNQFDLIQGEKNSIQPGKRPLSSMTPTLVMHNHHVMLIVGSPGGPRIITATLQTILNVIDYRLKIQDAVDAKRFHHQWLPDSIDIEANIFSPRIKEELNNRGYRMVERNPWSAVEAIYIDPVTKNYIGANDSRRPDGKAIGY